MARPCILIDAREQAPLRPQGGRVSIELIRAARAYVQRLGLALVVADKRGVPATLFFPHGVCDATKDLALLERAIAYTVGPTIAARVGRHLVLDVDAQHGGLEALARLEQQCGKLPVTWMQRTPSGGLHVWFRDFPLKEAKGKLCDGIEAKHDNQLVTLSPSTRKGGRYTWEQHPMKVQLARTPQWIINGLEVPPAPDATRGSDIPLERRAERARRYLELFEPAVSGNHGHSRTFLAAQIVTRGFAIEDEGAALAVLTQWNMRCDPPWNERELKRKVRQAMRRGRMQPGCMLEEPRA